MSEHVPLLRITGPKCNQVRNRELREGVWFLQYLGGEFEGIGGSVRIVVNSYRMKGMDWIVVPPVISYDKDSPVYKAIQKRSELPDGDKCQWGPEYNVTLDDGREALLWLGNKSSRNLMSSIRAGGEYILLPQRRSHDDFHWYVPNVVEATSFDGVCKK